MRKPGVLHWPVAAGVVVAASAGCGGRVEAPLDAAAAGDASTEAAVGSAACAPASTLCGGDIVQACGANGKWGSAAACTPNTVCTVGACTDECQAGAARCVGNLLQLCGKVGQWQQPAACPSATPVCLAERCAAPPSCSLAAPGTDYCGASSADSCCSSPLVSGGTLYRSYVNDGGGASAVANPASVSQFRLDAYDVTVGRFRTFVAAWNAGWTPPPGSGKHTHLNGGRGLIDVGGAADAAAAYEPGWLERDNPTAAPTEAELSCYPGVQTWTGVAARGELLPINCVNWYTAFAFCIWDGAFLPSAAEWEYAAAGGSEQREYPWGSTPPGAGNEYEVHGETYVCDAGPCIAPVGTASLGVGRWGQLDLLGNLFEWNLDWFGPFIEPCVDCAYLSSPPAPLRVRAGDSDYTSYATVLPFPTAAGSVPEQPSYTIGFRCARIP